MDDEGRKRLQREIFILRHQADQVHRTASSVDRAAARVTHGLLRQLAEETANGVLAGRWVDAKRDAQGKVPDDEVELAALGAMLIELAREGGKQSLLEAQRLAGEARYLLGRADAMADILQREEATPRPVPEVE